MRKHSSSSSLALELVLPCISLPALSAVLFWLYMYSSPANFMSGTKAVFEGNANEGGKIKDGTAETEILNLKLLNFFNFREATYKTLQMLVAAGNTLHVWHPGSDHIMTCHRSM